MSKKTKAREALQEFAEITFGSPLDKLSDKQRSLALLGFYIQKVYGPTRTEISDDDFEAGVVDNPHDLDVDFIHRDDKCVLIIQSRYRGLATKEEKTEHINFFQGVIGRLFGDDFKPNDRLKEIVAGIDFENDTFRMVYLSTGTITGLARKQADSLPTYPKQLKDIADRCEWDFIDESKLNVELRTAQSITAGAPDSEHLLYATGKSGNRLPILEIDSGGFRSVVMAVEATQLTGLYKHTKDALFNLNIRNYIGDSSTNKAIKKTAEDQPERFFYYNNGISCLAEEIITDQAKSCVRVRGIQVINGAQSLRALVKADSDKWSTDSPIVLVRITEVAKTYSGGGRLVEDITRYNNTQNVIKDSDFRSNDPIQSDLKERFARINRRGKQVCYVPKRTDKRPPNSEFIRLEEFAKTIYAFMKNPINFSGSTSFLFNGDPAGGGYTTVFGDGEQILEAFSPEEFHLRSAIWWMATEFAERIKEDRTAATDGLTKQALERKWMILYFSRLILERSFGEGYLKILQSHYKGDWHYAKGPVGLWYEALYKKAKEAVVYLYKNAAKTDNNFVHRNWMRSRSTILAMETYAAEAPGIEISKPGAS